MQDALAEFTYKKSALYGARKPHNSTPFQVLTVAIRANILYVVLKQAYT